MRKMVVRMVDTWFPQIDKKTWNKLSFYINIIMFLVVALFIYLLVMDVYYAGKLATQIYGPSDELSQAWVYIVRDIAFLAVAQTWIFVQLFKNQLLIIRRSW